MKIKLSLFLAVLVFASAQARGAVFQGSLNDSVASGGAVEESNIINIRECYLEDESLRFFAVNQEISISQLCPIACVVSDKYTYYHCQIDWSEASDADTSTAGRIKLKGKIIPPEGFQFNTNAVVEATALIYDNGDPTEELADITYDNDITLVHLSEDVSPYLEDTISLYTTSGDMFNGQIQWNNTTAPSTVGKFQAQGTIILPQGIKAKNENDLIIHRDFYAMKDDKIYIEPFYTHGGNIIFPWLYNARDTENIKIQYSYDNKSWYDSEEDEYGYTAGTYLLLFAALLEPHKDQYFRLFYKGEYTNTILVNTDVDPVIIDGDHDGGDNHEQPVPPVYDEIPVSKSSSTGAGMEKDKGTYEAPYSDNVKMLERVDLNTTIISGRRFMDIVEINNKIVFEKEGISAELTDDFAEENNIKADDTISVSINKNNNSEFSINVSINNNTVEKIPNTVIRFPHSEDNENPNDINEITLNETGSYSSDNKGNVTKISDDTLNYDESTDDKAVYPIIIFISSLIFFVLVFLLWRAYEKYSDSKK